MRLARCNWAPLQSALPQVAWTRSAKYRPRGSWHSTACCRSKTGSGPRPSAARATVLSHASAGQQPVAATRAQARRITAVNGGKLEGCSNSF